MWAGPARLGPARIRPAQRGLAHSAQRGLARSAHFMWIENTDPPRILLGPRARGLARFFFKF